MSNNWTPEEIDKMLDLMLPFTGSYPQLTGLCVRVEKQLGKGDCEQGATGLPLVGRLLWGLATRLREYRVYDAGTRLMRKGPLSGIETMMVRWALNTRSKEVIEKRIAVPDVDYLARVFNRPYSCEYVTAACLKYGPGKGSLGFGIKKANTNAPQG